MSSPKGGRGLGNWELFREKNPDYQWIGLVFLTCNLKHYVLVMKFNLSLHLFFLLTKRGIRRFWLQDYKVSSYAQRTSVNNPVDIVHPICIRLTRRVLGVRISHCQGRSNSSFSPRRFANYKNRTKQTGTRRVAWSEWKHKSTALLRGRDRCKFLQQE